MAPISLVPRSDITVLIVFLATVCLHCIQVEAESGAIYSFTDEQGIAHFSNVPADPRYRLTGDFGRRSYRASGPVGSGMDLAGPIKKAARDHGLDPALIRALIQAESGAVPDGLSPKGAIGLMQLMPETASELMVDPFDPESNIIGGSRYLREMLDRFNGDVILALAAYNAGPSAVERSNGIPPFPETRKYVRTVLDFWKKYRTSYR
jgi:soluble lytic murein transglycosylase-like protein